MKIQKVHADQKRLGGLLKLALTGRAVAAVGYEQHQFIAVRHSDQEHEHVHVAVNKVHPKTLKIHHPWNDIDSFKAPVTELGLHRVDRSPEKQRTAQSYQAREFEASRGEQSFSRWAKETVAASIDLPTIADWPGLHDRLSAHGVRLVLRGNGFALVDGARDPHLRPRQSQALQGCDRVRGGRRFGGRGRGALHESPVIRGLASPRSSHHVSRLLLAFSRAAAYCLRRGCEGGSRCFASERASRSRPAQSTGE